MDLWRNLKIQFPPEDQPFVEPLSAFVLSFVQALLKTGYYQSSHPGSTVAKRGLYQEWARLDYKDKEIAFITQETGGEEILIYGVLSEAVSLKKLFLPSVAELFIPKLRQYFDRRHLMSFTLKPGITREEFEGFVDIMAEPPTGPANHQSAAAVTQRLVDLKIVHVSVVYTEDMPLFERPMHWMARVILTRLGKDLHVIPLYKHLTQEQIKTLKAQIFQEVVRPLSNWEVLRDLLLNCDVLALPREEGAIDPISLEEALYKGLNRNQHLGLLLESARAVEDAPFLPSDRSSSVQRLITLVKRLLHDLPEGIEGRLSETLLETLLQKEVILLDDLPKGLVDTLLIKRKTEEYLKNKPRYWDMLQNGWPQETFFMAIPRVLLERDDFYSFGELLERLRRAFVKTFGSEERFMAESGLASLGESIVAKLQARRMERRKGMLAAVEPFADILAPYLFPLCAHEDLWLRRNICRIIAGVGRAVLPGLLAFAHEQRHWHAIRNTVMILGDIGVADDAALHFLKHCQQHPHMRVCEEVITSYGKIKGPSAEAALLHILENPHEALRARAVLALAQCNAEGESYREYLREALRKKRPEEPEVEASVQVACCRALESLTLLHPEWTSSFEPLLCAAVTGEKAFLPWMRKAREKEADVKRAIYRLLGAIGTRDALPVLTAGLTGQTAEEADRIQQAIQKIEQRQ